MRTAVTETSREYTGRLISGDEDRGHRQETFGQRDVHTLTKARLLSGNKRYQSSDATVKCRSIVSNA